MNIFDRIKNTLKIPDKINSRQICVVVFVAFPLAILAAIIIKPDNPVSVNENRTLKTGGDIRWEIFDGGFQEDLENCLSDQFPLRDNLKSAETGIRLRLGSGCIGGTYVGSDGRLFQRLLESDVDVDKCVRYAAKINRIAEQTGIETYVMYVPSAGISLREFMPYGAPMYDYDALFSALKRELKSAHVIDLSEALLGRPEYYYATDHHWTAAGAAAAYHEWIAAHGDEPTDEKAPEIITVSSNFRGTLWSRVPNAAIRGEPLWAFRVNDDVIVEADGMEISLYDYSALQTKDKYNFFEGGNHGILTLTNPNVKNGRTLMILKDSFANSFLPCIAGDYSKIIMVDERYAFIDAGQLAVDTGADEIAVIREIISVG